MFIAEEEKEHQGFSRKVKVDLFIDDRNLGGLPDWGTIYRMIKEKLTYEDLLREEEADDVYDKRKRTKPKKGFWSLFRSR